MAVLIPKIFIKYLVYILFIYSLVTVFYLLGGFEWGSSMDRQVRLDQQQQQQLFDDGLLPMTNIKPIDFGSTKSISFKLN